MRILVTGAKGFVGGNLVDNLRNLRDGKDRTRPRLAVDDVYAYDADSSPEQLDAYCADCGFVFHLAGVNRPERPSDYMSGNLGCAQTLLDALRRRRNPCPVMLASSIQASLVGRYDQDYGRSKRACEELFFRYARETGARALVYRFPNVFGKRCRPNYNSAVATFCHQIARGLPVTVRDPSAELELLYIDDLIRAMRDALEGRERRCDYDGLRVIPNESGGYCYAPPTYRATLGEIVGLLRQFSRQPETLFMPEAAPESFAKKLYATYLSYLPRERVSYPLDMRRDARGSFTELLKTERCGQFSVNVSKPGVTKGEHWHNSKWELFMVVSGHGLIRERRIGSDEVLEFEVSGDDIRAVHMLPGYAHSLTNLSDTEDLVTLMWANEPFDRDNPDTFREEV